MNIHEFYDCILTWESSMSNEDYQFLVDYINSIKNLDLKDETKQNLVNQQIRNILVREGLEKPQFITEWLESKQESYIDMIAYMKREKNWKMNNHV
jgi:chemotaxis methyl-accepting protein methylase|tara:strand:+ start:486 stop:773 length:288 start_codon:yes stop_codon:yes gene_type:complete